MEELLQKLQSIHGLSADQASGVLGTITGFIKEKFPMAAGAIDSMLPTGAANTNATTANAQATNAPQSGGGILDSISKLVPGGASVENLENLAKEKLGGLFGGNKTT